MPPISPIGHSRSGSQLTVIQTHGTLVSTLVIFVVAILACSPMIFFGASAGHSVVNNTIWLKHFSEQLSQGDIYPRWLMNINRGEGSPAFYYYAPLPFYIISIPALVFPTGSPQLQLAWGEILLLGSSGVTFFLYARKRFGVPASLLASIAYMLLPYHFETDLWLRQDLGELAGYVWMPLILLYTDALIAGSNTAAAGLSAAYCLLITSHLPSALLFTICLSAYALTQIAFQTWTKTILRLGCALAGGILLSGIYLGPALFSQQYVHLDAIWIPRNDFHGWFLPATAWATAHDHYPFVNRLFVGDSLTIVVFAMAWFSVLYHATARGVRIFIGALSMLSVATFLMSPASAIVWEHAPLLWKVQFPWRLSLVLDLSAAIAVLWAADRTFSERSRGSLFSLVLVASVLWWCTETANFKSTLTPYLEPDSAKELESEIRSDLELPEYATRWAPENIDELIDHVAPRDRLTLKGDLGRVTVTRWRPRRIEFYAQLSEPNQVAVHQFYFPNWSARDDAGNSLPTSADPSTGLLVIQLPAGHYHVNLTLAALPAEEIGWLVTLLAAGIMLLLRFGLTLRGPRLFMRNIA